MEQLGFQWRDFHENWYLSIFRKSVEKIKVSLKSDSDKVCFTLRPIYVYDKVENTAQLDRPRMTS